jgi:mRNA interferase MazF
VVVAALTSQLAAAELPGNAFLPATATGLPKDSVVNVTQIVTLNRLELVGPRAGQLPFALLGQVDAGLRLVFGL